MADKKKYGAFLIIAGVIVLTTVFAGLWLRRERQAELQAVDEEEEETSEVITLEVYGDYQCAPCAELHPTLKELKREYGQDLNYVFHNLPLSEVNKNALPAAQAAEAARMQGRFWDMHDRLYETQNTWKDDADPVPKFLKMAAELGLDQTRMAQDIENEQVRFRIEADRDNALSRGINTIPVVIINGRQLKPEATTPAGVKEGLEMTFTR